MNKLKILKDILDEYDNGIEDKPGAVAYESDRLIQGMRYILNQPDKEAKLLSDIVKPTASEVQQMIDEAVMKLEDEIEKLRASARLHHQNYHSSVTGGRPF